MVKVPAPRLTPFDLLAISKTPGIRIGSTPFGEEPGKVKYYIGAAVPWKRFLKGNKSLDEYLRSFAETFKGVGKAANVATGLAKAIDISRKAAGTYGVGSYIIASGTPFARPVTLPAKAAKQMTLAGKPTKPEAELLADRNAKAMRKDFGVKGEYKSLPRYRITAAMPAAPM